MSLTDRKDMNIFASPQGLYEESATKNHPLGTRLNLGGGNVYHYAMAGEALAKGDLLSWLATHTECAATKFDANAAGSRQVAIDVTIAANLCQDGYLFINDATAQLDLCMVHSNTAGTAGTTDSVVTLVRPTQTLFSATDTEGYLVTSPFYVQELNAANPSAECAMGGANTAITTQYYFWMQTWGVFCTNAGTTTVTAGATVQGAEDDHGAAQITVAAEALPGSICGIAPAAIADTEAGLVFLKCVP